MPSTHHCTLLPSTHHCTAQTSCYTALSSIILFSFLASTGCDCWIMPGCPCIRTAPVLRPQSYCPSPTSTTPALIWTLAPGLSLCGQASDIPGHSVSLASQPVTNHHWPGASARQVAYRLPMATQKHARSQDRVACSLWMPVLYGGLRSLVACALQCSMGLATIGHHKVTQTIGPIITQTWSGS